MRIGEEYKGCRYWGYQPSSADAPMKDKSGYRSDVSRLKATGDKHCAYGLTKEQAKAKATEIENRTGVEMSIFNHDYL